MPSHEQLLDLLLSQAGPRGATFLGRHIPQGQRPASLLSLLASTPEDVPDIEDFATLPGIMLAIRRQYPKGRFSSPYSIFNPYPANPPELVKYLREELGFNRDLIRRANATMANTEILKSLEILKGRRFRTSGTSPMPSVDVAPQGQTKNMEGRHILPESMAAINSAIKAHARKYKHLVAVGINPEVATERVGASLLDTLLGLDIFEK